MATIRFSRFTYGTVSERFLDIHSRVLFAMRTPNSHNHSYVHYSLSKFTGEWFANHSNHIHIFTPITRVVATKDKAHGLGTTRRSDRAGLNGGAVRTTHLHDNKVLYDCQSGNAERHSSITEKQSTEAPLSHLGQARNP